MVLLNDHHYQAATDIVSILSNLPKSTALSSLVGEETATAAYEMAKLLKRADLIPKFDSSKYSSNDLLVRVLKNKPA